MTKSIFPFPHAQETSVTEVGGKGYSLIISSTAGLPVPPGFILAVNFFNPWTTALKQTKIWKHFLKAENNDVKELCDRLKKEALAFSFTKEQQSALTDALKQFKETTVFAVRSSSPEEDLEGSSFAGGYETLLGVSKQKLHEAIKKAFVSCLDYRITVYKKENGFAITDPKIAVIIQQQIPSEVAGVGFSINPVTNNYDVAVFNANWGLGETVVSGMVTPDTFTVNKVSLQIIRKEIGSKQTSIWLTPTGGTEQKEERRNKEITLSDEQLYELTKLLKKVENLYQKPIDIEWAFYQNKLYLLQARPITTFIPLSPEMMTRPGENKRLYIDITTTIQGISKPVSLMGNSFFELLVGVIGNIIFRREIGKDISSAIPWISGGRIFVVISNIIALVGKEKAISVLNSMEPSTAKALTTVDINEYRPTAKKYIFLPTGLFMRLPGIFLFVNQAKHDPKKTHIFIQQELKAFEEYAHAKMNENLTSEQLIKDLLPTMFTKVFKRTVPMFVVSRSALGKMKKIVGSDHPELTKLDRSLPYNVTTEMGLALYQVARLLPKDVSESNFEKKLKANSLPENFLNTWNNFLERYGHRGPREIDIAAPRYGDDPRLLLDLLVTMRNAKGENPQEKFDRQQKEREQAYQKLYEHVLKTNPKKADEFAAHYRFFSTFGGYRETHKYYLIFIINLLRKKILNQAQKLLDTKKLDNLNQVFDLTIPQLDKTREDVTNDLRKLAEENTVFIRRLSRVPQLPAIIDSRGFIPAPPKPPTKKGEVVGVPISAGVVRGRIKVLHAPDEKSLEKGEILVARATDPGWTPLFVNAAGLIMEVGGVLQHGALVAREYGIPCVSGVDNATNLWKDGTLVEVDGTSGIIRELEKN